MRRILMIALTLGAGLSAYRLLRRSHTALQKSTKQESLGRWEDEGGAAQAVKPLASTS